MARTVTGRRLVHAWSTEGNSDEWIEALGELDEIVSSIEHEATEPELAGHWVFDGVRRRYDSDGRPMDAWVARAVGPRGSSEPEAMSQADETARAMLPGGRPLLTAEGVTPIAAMSALVPLTESRPSPATEVGGSDA